MSRKNTKELIEEFSQNVDPKAELKEMMAEAKESMKDKASLCVNEFTFHAVLCASEMDGYGYTTFVFEDLEYIKQEFRYIMCVMFPNWDQKEIAIGEVGYLCVRYVKAGKDSWFDGSDFVPYKYTDVHFIKFISEGEGLDEED